MTDEAATHRARLRLLEQKLAAREAELRAAHYELQKLSLSVKRGEWAERQLSEAWSEASGRFGAGLWRLRKLGRTLREQVQRRMERVREEASQDRGEAGPALSKALSLIPPAGRSRDVFCFPIIDWHFRFQRPQQLMTRLSRRGHRVFWAAPWFRGAGPPADLRPVAPGIWQVSLLGPDLNVYGDAPDEAVAARLANIIGELGREVGARNAVQIVELPFWWPVARHIREQAGWTVLYDCLDDHAGFTYHSAAATSLETGLIRHADVVVAASRPLLENVRRLGREATLVRNACDYEHFASVRHETSARPVIGYYGAIADWFDADLVADLASRQPGWDIILVGSTFGADLTRLRGLPNVRLVGERPYAEIPRWLSRFDVAILPFLRIPLTEATNPVKAYEILAAGRPLVSVPLPELLELGDLVRVASTPAEFEREIRAELEGGSEAHERRRREFARGETWEERVRRLEVLFSLKIGPEGPS